LNIPYYEENPTNFTIKRIFTDKLYCNIATGTRNNYEIVTVPLEKSPQFRGLSEKMDVYKNYLEKFIGGPLTGDYSGEGFACLAENFRYLEEPYENRYYRRKRHLFLMMLL